MKIGWVGLGKLGAPCALALAASGHAVRAVDPSPAVGEAVARRKWPHDEPGVTELLQSDIDFEMVGVDGMGAVDVVFVAVQTPHGEGYGGAVPMPDVLEPFDTSYLAAAVEQVVRAGGDAPLVIVSTVLPGTCARVVEPILAGRSFIYSPAFVAMGSVLRDLERPEFILAGVRETRDAGVLDEVYESSAPLLVTSVESAELAKMAYNTAISTKIMLANALMELSDKTGANVSEVCNVLAHATDRVASPRYLSGGMGDGGPCHPRDAIAMAWLAESVGLSADPFGFVVRAREAQTAWLARKVIALHRARSLPVTILGRAYKAGVSLEDGSPALLLGHYLAESGVNAWWVDERCGYPAVQMSPAIYVLATPHPELVALELPPGSVLIDPWDVAPEQAGVEIVRVGR